MLVDICKSLTLTKKRLKAFTKRRKNLCFSKRIGDCEAIIRQRIGLRPIKLLFSSYFPFRSRKGQRGEQSCYKVE